MPGLRWALLLSTAFFNGLLALGDVADLDNDTFTVEPIDIDLVGEDREVAYPFSSNTGKDASCGGRISGMGCFEKQSPLGPGGGN